MKARDRPALERTFSFIQHSDPRLRQIHSPSAELIRQSILADSSKPGVGVPRALRCAVCYHW